MASIEIRLDGMTFNLTTTDAYVAAAELAITEHLASGHGLAIAGIDPQGQEGGSSAEPGSTMTVWAGREPLIVFTHKEELDEKALQEDLQVIKEGLDKHSTFVFPSESPDIR